MGRYGYCRISPDLPSEGRQVSALLRAGVRERDIYIDRPDDGPLYCPAFSQLQSRVQKGDAVVVCHLLALGESCEEIAWKWDKLTRTMQCDIDVLDCPVLSTTAYRRETERTLVTEVCFAVLSHLGCIGHGRNRSGRPRIERPENFSEVYQQVREGRITNREAMRRLGLRPNTYYKFVHEERN